MPSWGVRLALCTAALVLLSACGALIGLDELEKTDCVACAGGAGSGSFAGSGGAMSAAGSATLSGGAGSLVVAGAAGAPAAGGATGGDSARAGAPGSAGAAGQAAGAAGQAAGAGGASTGGAGPGACPGGAEPPAEWTEDWLTHSQRLSRAFYDDCIALYFDPDVAAATVDWMAPLLSEAWAYTLGAYGELGSDRLFVVVHRGRHLGGHAATFDVPSHHYRNVVDIGADDWPEGSYAVPLHLMGLLVDAEGAQPKLGAPMAARYGNVGFPLIYRYDLLLALGLTEAANESLTSFLEQSNDEPTRGTFWFRDWFHPLWLEEESAQVFVRYMSLLRLYYPAAADGWMDTMNYGQYVHFMSGAARKSLLPRARQVLGWGPLHDAELAAARFDFPEIEY
jgi:hypothetical protein